MSTLRTPWFAWSSRRLLALPLAATCVCTLAVVTAAPTFGQAQAGDPVAQTGEVDVSALIEAYTKERADLFAAGGVTRDSYAALIDKYRSQIDPATLTLDETVAVINANLQWNSPEYTKSLADRLSTWTGDQGVNGAVASIHHVSLMNSQRGEGAPTPDEKSEMVANLLKHPALMRAAMQGHASSLFNLISSIGDNQIYRENEEAILGLANLINDDMPADGAMVFEGYFNILGTLVDAAENEAEKANLEAQRQQIRKKMVDFMAGILAKPAEETPGIEPGRRDWLGKSMARLNGAAARGELLNHSAPAVNFTWSSDGKLSSLKDLSGQVVVLDFWATWCGPCIRSFPNVAKLTAFYKDYPVAVVGVTSLQGRHYGASGVIETKDDPAREHELMNEFITEKDMTWTVAFSEADVFNPEYGVRGIPHVAIVDPKGIVRENGLHPGGNLMEKAKKINKMLEAAGLPAPSLEGLDDNLDPVGG